jgi:hypothetical protein
LCLPTIYLYFTMNYTLWAYALSFTIEAEIQYLLLRMLLTSFSWRNICKWLIIRKFRCWSNIWSCESWVIIGNRSSLNCASVIASIYSNSTSFCVIKLSSIAIRWFNISRFASLYCRLGIRTPISYSWWFSHRFQYINTLRVKWCLLMTLLTYNNLKI